jgi:nucleoside phosphorylase
MILLCTATGLEAQACREGLRQAGHLAAATDTTPQFEIIKTGMGQKNAHHGLAERLALRTRPRPSLIISTGVAGSLSPGVGIGTWAWAKSLRAESGEPLELDSPAHPFAEKTRRIRAVDFLSLHGPLSTPHVGPGPLLVDMESLAWAEVSRRHKIPFMVLRMVSDCPEQPLPEAIHSFVLASVAESWRERVEHGLRGTSRLARRPLSLGRFILQSRNLPRMFSQGWAEFSRI